VPVLQGQNKLFNAALVAINLEPGKETTTIK